MKADPEFGWGHPGEEIQLRMFENILRLSRQLFLNYFLEEGPSVRYLFNW